MQSFKIIGTGVILLLALMLAGCAETPTPTPIPTATPTPTVTPTPVPEVLSMRDFVLGPTTTGGDLFARLSDQETACIRGLLGDAVYEAMLGFPLSAGGGDPASAAQLFGCMTPENAVLVGVAFLDAAAGGRSDESRACIADFALQHPEFIYARLGFELPEATTFDGTETRNVLVGFYDCMAEDEKAVALIDLYTSIDNLSSLTGEDLVALLSEPEASCVSDTLSEAEYGAMVTATPLRAAGLGVSAAECLELDSVVAFLLAATEAQIGDLSDGSAACASDFIRNHPTHIATIAAPIGGDPSQASPADFNEAAIAGFDLFTCLNEDELTGLEATLMALGA